MPLKVAIYSGIIPSSTFIDKLIDKLAEDGVGVYLFGKCSVSNTSYPKNVKLYPTPSHGLLLVLFVLQNLILLSVKNPVALKKLSDHIRSRPANGWKDILFLWGKFLPVIVHLPDIFHVQWVKNIEDWIFLKTIYGVKLVASLRGTQINISPVVDTGIEISYKAVFPLVDGFHAVSKAIAQEGMRYGGTSGNTKVIYSGVDIADIAAFRKENYHFQEPLQILSIGRFHWTKGYNYALDGLWYLSKKNYNFRYTIITNKITEENLYQIHVLGLSGRVTIVGRMPQKQVFRCMQQSDILLLPSVEEGIANVVLEAMAIGLPVVSSNCGGMAEVIEDGVNGFLFESRNIDSMVTRIEAAQQLHPEERAALAEAARCTIAKQHAIENLGREMTMLYESVLCASD